MYDHYLCHSANKTILQFLRTYVCIELQKNDYFFGASVNGPVGVITHTRLPLVVVVASNPRTEEKIDT